MSNLPTINQLYKDKELAIKNDQFTALMNQPPSDNWVKTHPFIRGYKYLPIERVEWLLKTIFKRYRIEITGQGTAFNGVWVTVRVHFPNPVSGEWDYHDGIGAAQMQTAKGTSAADLANINNGALSMAFPMAKTIAIKDACDHFGKLFGADLNRKDVISYTPDMTLIDLDENHPNWGKVVAAIESGKYTVEDVEKRYNIKEQSKTTLYEIQNQSK